MQQVMLGYNELVHVMCPMVHMLWIISNLATW